MKNSRHVRNNARKVRALRLKGDIMRLLKWDDLQYGNLQYESGMAYLNEYLYGDAHTVDKLSRSKVFWLWWRNHWTNRDEQFIDIHKSVTINSYEVRRQLYEQFNEGEMLAECIHPNSVVLNETYAEMITVYIETEIETV